MWRGNSTRSPSRCFRLRVNNPFDPEMNISYSKPAYYLRLAVGDLLPDLDRVIYFDVDLLVRTDLAALYDTDLGDTVLAEAPDACVERIRKEPRKAKKLPFSSVIMRDYANNLLGRDDAIYFNTGVLVIDLKKWRSLDIISQCLSFLEDATYVIFADQDAMNKVFQGKITLLDSSWNFVPFVEKEQNLKLPRIMHFAGFKPWKPEDEPQPFDDEYWAFAMSTPFGEKLRRMFYGSIDWHIRHLRQRSEKIPLGVRDLRIFSEADKAASSPWYRRLF